MGSNGMNPAVLMRPYVEAFLRLIYPAECGVCRAFLALEENGICKSCRAQLEILRFSREDAILKDRFEYLDEGWALYAYESPLKEIITAIKFARKRWLVRTFMEAVESLAVPLATENHYDAIVPIPIDRHRLLEREFNQAELLARLLARSTGITLETQLLRKRRATFAQSRLGREERKVNPRGAFRVSRFRAVRGKSFLMVDDIFTTGATAEEAARTLKQRGARRADLFALARTSLK